MSVANSNVILTKQLTNKKKSDPIELDEEEKEEGESPPISKY
jgi:hypothetical protein